MVAEVALRPAPSFTLPAEFHRVAAFLDASLAPSTRRAYAVGMRSFQAWCNASGYTVLPAAPETVLHGIAAEPEREPTTERVAALCEAVAQLSDKRREVVLLCYHEGLTHQQAAAVLEVPIGTLKSRLSAALTDLRARLTDEVAAS